MSFDARFLLAAALVAVATAACTSTAPGSPRASSSTNTTMATSTTVGVTPTTPNLPARPREIRLDGLDLCTLWTLQQLGELGVRTQPGSRRTDASGRPFCASESENRPLVGVSATARLDEDLTKWLGPGQVHTTEVARVAGFPAVQVYDKGTASRLCSVMVGTTEGQYLHVQVVLFTGGAFTVEQLCEKAVKAATFATQTLQTLR